MNTFPSNIKQKFNSTIPDMADHPWPFTQKRYLRCGIYIISNNTIIYDYPKTIECTLCEHSIAMYSSSGLLLYLYFAITTRYPLSHSFTAIYRSDHTVYPTVVLFRVYRSNDFSSNTAGQQLAEQAKELVLRSCHTNRLALLLCDFRDVCTDHFRVRAILLVFLHLTNTARDSASVFLVANDYLLPCLREACVDITQLNNCHLNAIRLYLIVQRAGVRGNRRFAGGVASLLPKESLLLPSEPHFHRSHPR